MKLKMDVFTGEVREDDTPIPGAGLALDPETKTMSVVESQEYTAWHAGQGVEFINGNTITVPGGTSGDSAVAVSMTTAERTATTPDAGVLIWDTDLEKLYVGDGSTAGGVEIEGGGGEGTVTGIAASVDGNTATITATGSTTSVKFVGVGGTTVSEGAGGEIQIGGGGGGGGSYDFNTEEFSVQGSSVSLNKTMLSGIEPYHSRTVRTIAHRGASEIAPENTAPAYILARQLGYTIAETDSRMTQDGKFIMWHDQNLLKLGAYLFDVDGRYMYRLGTLGNYYFYDRFAKKNYRLHENGTYEEVSIGISSLVPCMGADYRVEDLPFYVLNVLDFGAWKSDKFKGTHCLEFEAMVKLFKTLGLELYLDQTGSVRNETAITAEGAILKKYGMLDKTTWIGIAGVSHANWVRAVDSTARLGINFVPSSELISTFSSLNTGRGVFFNGTHGEITQEVVQLGLDAGFGVECYLTALDNVTDSWVLNRIAYLINCGVQGITTDRFRVETIIPPMDIDMSVQPAKYVVVNTTGTSSGTLYDALTTSQSTPYVAFDASINGSTVRFEGASVTYTKQVEGNGATNTILTGNINPGSDTVFENLALADVGVTGGTMYLGSKAVVAPGTSAVTSGGIIELAGGTNGGTMYTSNGKVRIGYGTNNGMIYASGGIDLPLRATLLGSGIVDFTGNTSQYGFQVGTSRSLTLSGGTFTKFTTSALVNMTSASLTAISCTFTSNGSSGIYGDAVTAQHAAIVLSSCTFSSNIGSYDVFCNGTGTIDITDCVFKRITPFNAAITATLAGSNRVGRLDGSCKLTIMSGAIVDFTGNATNSPIACTGGVIVSGSCTVINSAGSSVPISGGTYTKINKDGTTA